MSKLVNPVTVGPSELAAGDVMVVVVTCHIMQCGDGLSYRLYRCGYPPPEIKGIPQGSRILGEKEVAQSLFPVVGWAGAEPDI